MTVDPDLVNGSFAQIQFAGDGTNGVTNPRINGRVICRFGSNSNPAATADTQTDTNALFLVGGATVDVAWRLDGHASAALLDPSNTGVFGIYLYLFPDGQDGAGAGTGNVISLQLKASGSETFPSENSGGTYQSITSGTSSFTVPQEAGSYRAVLVIHDGVGSPPDIGNVADNGDFYFDSDRNSDFQDGGALAPQAHVDAYNGNQMSAWLRVAADVQSLTFTGPSEKNYGETFTISADIHDTAVVNPKNVRLAMDVDTDDMDSSPIDSGSLTVTAGTGAVGPTAAFRIDTSYSLTPVDHTTRIYVGPSGGQSTTPTNEEPDTLNIAGATITVPDTNDQAWVVFNNGSTDYAYEGGIADIASGITIFEDSGFTTPGAQSFQDAGYTIPQNIFKRRNTTTTEHAIPRLEVYVQNGHGTALVSTAVRLEVQRQSNDSVENGQNISTDANGRVRWNYTISATNPAFNRYVKTGSSRQSGSHVGTGPDDPLSPPATFSVANSDYPSDYPGPFPGYPRRVYVRGNAFSGAAEPEDEDDNVFGVNSELVAEALWTGSLTAAALDGNGVPTGAGNREQPLGSGSLKAKLTTTINEGTVKVDNLGEHNIKDVAGRDISLSGSEEIDLRRALWNVSLGTVDDAGSDLADSQFSLESPLTYKTGNNSLDSIDAPADPSSLAYYQGFADTSAQRTSFTLTTDLTNVGFTSDSGNYGYLRQPISFFAIDLGITCVVTPEVTQSAPTLTRRFGVKVLRVTTDNQFVGVAPDEAPIYAAYGMDATTGLQVLLESGSCATTASDSDFYVDLVIPSDYFAVKVIAFAKVNGSRTPGGDGTPVQIGFEFDAVDFAAGIPFR